MKRLLLIAALTWWWENLPSPMERARDAYLAARARAEAELERQAGAGASSAGVAIREDIARAQALFERGVTEGATRWVQEAADLLERHGGPDGP